MKLILIAIASVCMLTSCTKAEDAITQYTYTYSADELELLNKINHYRDSIGVGEVVIEEHASYLCSTHNEYMIENNIVNHDFFYDRSQSIVDVYQAVHVGEIVAYNYQTNQTVLTAWCNSPCHDTIIKSEFTRIGISIRENSQHRKFYTVVFFD